LILFKNVMAYRIGADWTISLTQLEEALDSYRFVECSPSQDKSVGWAEPRGQAHGPLVESVGGQWILKLQIETKAVPGSVVRRKADERIQEIEATTGRKPGKKESREIREDIVHTLLPLAFSKQSQVMVWMDMDSRLLVTDAASQGKSDEVITALVRVLDGLPLTLLQTTVSAQSAMSQWLLTEKEDDLPPAFSVERECVLKSTNEDQAVVKFTRHLLATDEVRKHVREGKLPTQLALSWEGKASFVLTETLVLKKVTYLDGVMEDAGADDDKFDADVILSTGTLGPLLVDLIDALGGEMSFVITPGTSDTLTAPIAAKPAAAPKGAHAEAAAGEDLSDSPFV
jgi:recombination associated protein RdgC